MTGSKKGINSNCIKEAKGKLQKFWGAYREGWARSYISKVKSGI